MGLQIQSGSERDDSKRIAGLLGTPMGLFPRVRQCNVFMAVSLQSTISEKL